MVLRMNLARLSWIRPISEKLRTYRTCPRANSAVEFALVVPLLLAIFQGGTEYTRMTIVQSRLDAASHNIGQILVAANSMTPARRNQMIWSEIMPTVLHGLDQSRIVATVAQVRHAPPLSVDWQTSPTTGPSSVLPTTGGTGLPPGSTAIVVDLRYQLRPMIFSGLFSGFQLKARSVHRQSSAL